ncbi:uncharacterized protein LACBIDRAFT_303237 [Laccaria bicolor S238N-H82]|uniref:Uncharacterized protein FAD12-4 n=1 Tax=Laccaria bicolor (strain S238N-H82 / ATCC MYA-4686) TaxID=486041 RepID=B0DJ67_LACBS|nr:uncharacterized protein LACBIDRAFT_303237 [Laccaria bicolor S238N-H82]EDR05353.1 hypothetical protein LACBIDRAFT_303237 [Laccaria bicolor S238N-H82]|eukprot:XP_001883911.1 hypothetical protein LACBIDRAFT_303237 [Laccaria bicolor S238N-H82]
MKIRTYSSFKPSSDVQFINTTILLDSRKPFIQTVTLKEIHNAVPKHLLQKQPLTSTRYILQDLSTSTLVYFVLVVDFYIFDNDDSVSHIFIQSIGHDRVTERYTTALISSGSYFIPTSSSYILHGVCMGLQ